MIKLIVLPNLLTTLNLYFGFLSIIETSAGNFVKAALYIIIASIFDMLDGRVARAFKETSKFGVEYDSIADIVSFGIAPAFLIYVSNNLVKGRYEIALTFIYIVAGALRLARFNILESKEHQKYFVGLPIPMAAILISSFVLYSNKFGYAHNLLGFVPFFYVVLALLMISSINFPSFKEIDSQKSLYFFFVIILLLTLFILFPYHFLLIFSSTYILYGVSSHLVGIFKKHKKKNNH